VGTRIAAMAEPPVQPKAPPAGLNVALISEHIARGVSPVVVAPVPSSSKGNNEPFEPLRDRYGRAAPAIPPPTRLTAPGPAGAAGETQCITEVQQSRSSSAPEVAPEPRPEFLEFRDGDFYCLLCKQWATEAHLSSKKHTRRAETPEYYLWEGTTLPRSNAEGGAPAAAKAAAAVAAARNLGDAGLL